MITRVFPQLFRHLFSRAFTNPYLAVHMPPSLTEALSDSAPTPPNPPLPVERRFRGLINLDRNKCIGCRLCIKVCPANAITYLAESKKVMIHNDRCCFCAQCTEICPVKCLVASDTYMISSYNRRENVAADSGKSA